MAKIIPILLLLAGCSSLPDTPIGNYDGWGKCQPGQCSKPEPTVTYRCMNGSTEVIVRGAKNPDPQTCVPVEHI